MVAYSATTLSGLMKIGTLTQGSSQARNPGLDDLNPFGVPAPLSLSRTVHQNICIDAVSTVFKKMVGRPPHGTRTRHG
jgi:hypothetical protein